MVYFMTQVARSRHQLTEYLTWKDGDNRRLFTIFRKCTIFRKLKSRKEKSSFKWNYRTNGGQIYWREAIQCSYIGSGVLCSVTIHLAII